jgi:hypothetical protein
LESNPRLLAVVAYVDSALDLLADDVVERAVDFPGEFLSIDRLAVIPLDQQRFKPLRTR